MNSQSQEILSRFNRVYRIKDGMHQSRTTIVLHSEYYQAKEHFYDILSCFLSEELEPVASLHNLTIKLDIQGEEKIIKFTSRDKIDPLSGYERGSSIVICG